MHNQAEPRLLVGPGGPCCCLATLRKPDTELRAKAGQRGGDIPRAQGRPRGQPVSQALTQVVEDARLLVLDVLMSHRLAREDLSPVRREAWSPDVDGGTGVPGHGPRARKRICQETLSLRGSEKGPSCLASPCA